jgi:hypothetical protein
MIDESSLKYPVADYLTGLELPLVQIKLEYSHPLLKKRMIDLITTDATKKKIECAFEFKISANTTKYEAEQKRIFNDLMRLHMLHHTFGTEAYFVIAGSFSEFIQFFRSILTTKPASGTTSLPVEQGFYTEWFKFKASDTKVFDVKNASVKVYKDIYEAFLADYMPKVDTNTLTLPNSISTKCIAISALSREYPTPYVCGIWQVF